MTGDEIETDGRETDGRVWGPLMDSVAGVSFVAGLEDPGSDSMIPPFPELDKVFDGRA